jgi:hypothetical protein
MEFDATDARPLGRVDATVYYTTILAVVTHAHWLAWSAVAGLALGAIYTLSPLTVWALALAVPVVSLAGRGLPRSEARLLRAVLLVALAVRLLAIGSVFLTTMPKHDDQTVGSLSGDEAYGLSRAIRTRNILIGEPVSKYDYIVAVTQGRPAAVDWTRPGHALVRTPRVCPKRLIDTASSNPFTLTGLSMNASFSHNVIFSLKSWSL